MDVKIKDMYTENIDAINHNISVNCKFASIMYSRMMTDRFGVQSCNNCGVNDIVAGKNIHVLNKELMSLGEMSDNGLEDSFNHTLVDCEIILSRKE